MANLPPRSSLRWFRVSDVPAVLECLSDCYAWQSHWDVDAGRTRKCAGVDCLMCAEGSEVVNRYVFIVRCEMGIAWLLELRDGQRRAVEQANISGSCSGARFQVRREGRAITAVFFGRSDSPEMRSIEALGETLGLPGIRQHRSVSPEMIEAEVDWEDDYSDVASS